MRGAADDDRYDKLNAALRYEGEGDWWLRIAADDAAVAAAVAEVEEGEQNRGESEMKERGRWSWW
jgi:hypothetical protein